MELKQLNTGEKDFKSLLMVNKDLIERIALDAVNRAFNKRGRFEPLANED